MKDIPAKVIGHRLQRDRLRDLLLGERLPGAMIFSGQSGIGKLMVAKELARSLLCSNNSTSERRSRKPLYGGCAECGACHTFDAHNHPDFHLVDCLDRDSSNAASTRALLSVLSLRSFSGSNRAVILNNAEHLSLQICNILLKSLEEPRPGLYFILVTSNHSRLPPTLLSRCQIWHFDRLSESEILRILRSKASEGEAPGLAESSLTLDELAVLADGSLENIDRIFENEQIWKAIKDALSALFDGSADPTLELFREIAKDKDRLRNRLHLIRIYARQRMLTAKEPAAMRLWSILLSNILSAEELIFERNLAAAYVLTASILDFMSAPLPPSFTAHLGSVNLITKTVV